MGLYLPIATKPCDVSNPPCVTLYCQRIITNKELTLAPQLEVVEVVEVVEENTG